MKAALAIALGTVLVGACSIGALDGGDDGTPDGGVGCSIFIDFQPAGSIEAGPNARVRAIANVLPQTGVAIYTWDVQFGGQTVPFSFEQIDQSEIEFIAEDIGFYTVTLGADQPGPGCVSTSVEYNATAPSANTKSYRLHVAPPNSFAAPPVDKIQEVAGGGDASIMNVTVDPGTMVSGTVKSTTGANVAAYLRFMPSSGPDGFVEAFSIATSAAFSARLLNIPHDVLVVPSTAGVVAKLVPDWTPQAPAITLDDGIAISGTVLDAAGAPLAGAKVRAVSLVTIAGTPIEIPSTLATSSGTGAFTVRASFPVGSTVEFQVTPPANSGLARLTGSSAAFELGQPVTIRYASVAQRSLGGTVVRRAGQPLGGAKVIAVGRFTNRGTITAGATTEQAAGEYRIEAIANGAGVLPATQVPALDLDAVIQVSAGDFAVDDLNLVTQVPASLDAPPMVQASTVLQKFDGTAAPGIVVDAVPVGPLAFAGAPHVHASSGDGGATTLRIAARGTYDFHVRDPIGRGASVIEPNVSSSAVDPSFKLGKHISISGKLVTPSGSPVGNASVQLLCADCTGVARSRPIGETASGIDGKFAIAVPDPGTMGKPMPPSRPPSRPTTSERAP